MDFDLGEQAAELRTRLRSLIAAHIADDYLGAFTADPADLDVAQRFCRTLADEGLLTLAWPAEYGGGGGSVWDQTVVREEMWAHHEPRGAQYMGLNWVGPAIMAFGTDEQKAQHLSAIAAGEVIWCQGFSEPEAGSDLAGIKTKAIRDGDHYVLNGQKTWCSRGAFADWIFCIVRTDPEAERHAGLTYLLVPADAPGMERRPIGRLDGEPGFAEIFFDDCRVSTEHVLGEEGQGWAVAMAAAGSERGLNLRSPGRFMAAAERLTGLVRDLTAQGRDVDVRLRDEVTDAWIRAQAYRWQTYMIAAKLMDGAEIGSEASLMKVFWSEMDLELHATALRLLGARGEVVEGNDWLDGYVFALSGPIYAGTNEIQRNIIAERVLGLPRR